MQCSEPCTAVHSIPPVSPPGLALLGHWRETREVRALVRPIRFPLVQDHAERPTAPYFLNALEGHNRSAHAAPKLVISSVRIARRQSAAHGDEPRRASGAAMEPPMQRPHLCGEFPERPPHDDAGHDGLDGQGSHRRGRHSHLGSRATWRAVPPSRRTRCGPGRPTRVPPPVRFRPCRSTPAAVADPVGTRYRRRSEGSCHQVSSTVIAITTPAPAAGDQTRALKASPVRHGTRTWPH